MTLDELSKQRLETALDDAIAQVDVARAAETAACEALHAARWSSTHVVHQRSALYTCEILADGGEAAVRASLKGAIVAFDLNFPRTDHPCPECWAFWSGILNSPWRSA